MNSEERRDEVGEMIAQGGYDLEQAGVQTGAEDSPDVQSLNKARQVFQDAEECLLQALSRDRRGAYLNAKKLLLWEHMQHID